MEEWWKQAEQWKTDAEKWRTQTETTRQEFEGGIEIRCVKIIELFEFWFEGKSIIETRAEVLHNEFTLFVKK